MTVNGAQTDGTTDDVRGPSYRALALQARCDAIVDLGEAEARDAIVAAIGRLGRQVAASVGFIGPDTRLVVLPEYVLTGHPIGHGVEQWARLAAVDQDGPEEEALGEIAQRHRLFLATNLYERDPNFPGLYFQAQVVHGPTGDVVLRYRRLNSMFTATPHDVLDRWVELYGPDSLFPVADTEIGVLACIASEEILFPEVARCLAMRGAEVFLHGTSEVASPDVTAKDVAKRARAQENVAWLVSANTAGITGSPIPGASTDGGSQIVDHTGRVVVQAGSGETMVANGEIDVEALRRARRRPGMANLHARNRFDLYASEYATHASHVGNGLGDGKVPDRAWFVEAQREAITRLFEQGAIR